MSFAKKYLEYCQATQRRWMLYDYITLPLLEDVTTLIAQSSVVNDILFCQPSPMPTVHSNSLAVALATNSSLTALEIRDVLHNVDCNMQPVFDVLATKSQLRALHLSSIDNSLTGELFPLVVRICRNCSTLTELTLEDNFTEHQYLQLFEALNGQDRLTRLRIGDIDSWSQNTLSVFARFLNENKNITSYHAHVARDTVEFLATLTDVSVIGYTSNQNVDSSIVAVAHFDSRTPYTHEPNMTELFLDILPLEISKKILYSLNIGPLMSLFRTSKRSLEFSQSYDFWHTYYLSHFDCIPEDLLEFICIKHGDLLLNKNSINELFPTNIWLLTLQAMTVVYQVKPADLPQDRNPLIQLVSKSFPQLKSQTSSYGSSFDGFTWLTSVCGAYEIYWTVHKLGLQYQPEFNQYSAILLRKHEYVDGFPHRVEQFERLEYILDWTVANDPKQFVNQVKHLIEMFLLLRYNSEFEICREIIPKSKLKEHFITIDEATRNINVKIEEYAAMVETNQFDLQLIERSIIRLKQLPIHQLDYAMCKQILPKRTEVDAFKNYMQHHRDWEFYRKDWKDFVHVQLFSGKTKHRQSKNIAKVLVLRWIRVMLNYLMLPLLQLFWPRDMTDPDFNAYSYTLNYNFTQDYQQFYSSHVLANKVTIYHSFPWYWPVLVTGMSRLILGHVLEIITATLNNKPLGPSIEQLMKALQTTGFYPKSALTMIQAFFKNEFPS